MNDTLTLYIKKKKPRTRSLYLFCAKKLDCFLKKNNLTLKTMQPEDVFKFVTEKRTKDTEYSDNTQAMFKQFTLSVLMFVGREEYFIKTVRSNLRIIKHQSNFKVDLTEDEIRRLIEVTKQPELKLAWSLMANVGLRVGEFLGLRFSDITVAKKRLVLKRREADPNNKQDYHSKGMEIGESETLPVDDQSLQLFSALQFKTGERIFPYSYKTLRSYFVKYIKKAKIERETFPLTPHKLRHYFGHHWSNNKGSIQHLKSLLRHSDLKYTLLYSIPSEEELEDSFCKIINKKRRV